MRLALILCCATLLGEDRTLTLRDAVGLALKQNPDLLLARLDERKAEQAIRLAKDPFIPKPVVGSGLAWTSGFPMSIEGATPSILQARAIGTVFDRPQSYKVAAARENRRTAALDTSAKEEEVAWRTTEIFLDAENAAKALQVVQREVEAAGRVLESVRARVAEGRELPIEAKRAELALARARYRVQTLEAARRAHEDALGEVAGLDSGVRARVLPAERPAPPQPASADAAVEEALRNSKEIRTLESKLVSKGLDVRSARASWLPRADLVAQYGLLGRFNNYEEFFRKFVRHNGQVGVSFQFPIWPGAGAGSQAAQAEAEVAQLRVQLRTARRRIEEQTRRAFDDIQQAEAGVQVARLDLEVARDQVSILLAQAGEGRASLRQVEEARTLETDKWVAFYDSAAALEKARYALLRQTGGLMAALR